MQRLRVLRVVPLLVLLLVHIPASAQSVLVLPFYNHSNSPNLDWISESIADSLRESLAAENLLVLSREDRLEACRRLSVSPQAELTLATILKIGMTLDASQVIYGTFEVTPLATPGVPPGNPASTAAVGASSGEAQPEKSDPARTLKIQAHVVDLVKMKKVAEWQASGTLENLARVQQQLAWQTLKQLAPRTTPSEETYLAKFLPIRLDAQENYVRGLIATNEEQKHRYFTTAIRLDERMSGAAYQLGKLQLVKKNYRVAAEWLARVPQQDPHYLESSFLLGLCRYHTVDFKGARDAFEVVARSVPLNEVLNNLGATQLRLDSPEAVATLTHALEGDPNDPVYHFNLGYALWKKGEFTEATDHFKAVLAANPQDADAALLLSRCHKRIGPRPRDPKSSGLERLKNNYEETAYRQLKAVLEAGKS